MRISLTAVLVAVGVVLIYLAYTEFPLVSAYQACFTTAYSILDEAGSVTRHAYVTDDVICNEHKQTLMTALSCFKTTDQKPHLDLPVKPFLLSIAQTLAKGTQSMPEMVAEHNKRCMYPTTTLQFDPRTNEWY